MNYQQYASFNNNAYQDTKNEISNLDKNNLTITDVYKMPFLLTNGNKQNFQKLAANIYNSVDYNSDLGKLFFSNKNIKRIQRMIKDAVYIRTNHEYKLSVDQDEKKISIYMQSVFLEHAKINSNKLINSIQLIFTDYLTVMAEKWCPNI